MNSTWSDTTQLLEEVLRDQQDLTAVEKFAQSGTSSVQSRRYRDLLPLRTPKSGEQYAFEVDLDACTGCKSCVAACHNLNGLDDDESWRSVGALIGGSKTLPMLQMVTASCHHCAHPACMDGCPVKAYEKDSITGIVKHLDDQCIGCQYCIMKCPYDAPKYNARQGIVRKCDMCSSRLSAGEAPACVQACPSSAIRITLVHNERNEQAPVSIPWMHAPAYTFPTTKYKRRAPFPAGTRAADAHRVKPQSAHFTLISMLILTQLSVGSFAVELFNPVSSVQPEILSAFLAAGLIGMACAVLHLGRPLYAFRALLGLKTSWLSREVAAFGIFAAAASACVVSAWLAAPMSIQCALHGLTVISGLLAVFCSVQIYADTRRPFWNLADTAAKFYLSAAICGCAAAQLTRPTQFCFALAVLSLTKLATEARIFRHLYARGTTTPQRKSAILLARDLGAVTVTRFAVGIAGGVLLPLMLMAKTNAATIDSPLVFVIFALTLLGEVLERYLFFRAVVVLKMPGEAAA